MRAALFETILYVASSNPGKLRDFAAASAMLPDSPDRRFVLRTLPGLVQMPPPVEDAETFAGNASLKAIAYSLRAPGKIVVGDDSGLEVFALGGAPGVHSARYAALGGGAHPWDAGESGSKPGTCDREARPTDAQNNAYLLQQLAAIPGASRRARYRCVLAAARDGMLLGKGARPALGIGSVEGILLDQPRGSHGFGYDPLFLLADYDQTMAEIDAQTRLKVSHRTRALVNLLPLLGDYE